MIRFGYLEKDYMYSLFRGVIYSYNSWQGLKIATWQIWLHDSLRAPPQVNKLQKISASIEAAVK